jgi:ornithine lipid ester-linked acyl 2-hydroxylase
MNLVRNIGRYQRRLVLATGFEMLCALEKVIAKFSPVGTPSLIDPAHFQWTSELESNWQDIANELKMLLRYRERLPNFQDISEDQRRFTTDDKWKTYFFYCFGVKSEKNCRRCPRTTELIERIPGLQTAFFSILAPQKHIPRHRGIYKGVIRYHLGLIVPEERQRCRMQVGSEMVNWEPGGSVFFDDTYPHEVWNDTDQERVVLLMDVLRPFPNVLARLNRFVLKMIQRSPFVQDGVRRELEWEKAFYDAYGQP